MADEKKDVIVETKTWKADGNGPKVNKAFIWGDSEEIYTRNPVAGFLRKIHYDFDTYALKGMMGSCQLKISIIPRNSPNNPFKQWIYALKSSDELTLDGEIPANSSVVFSLQCTAQPPGEISIPIITVKATYQSYL